ncbi:MAG: hypothetical protein AB1656_13840, partial [Candidatus Omnitrophota bacterium]
NLYIGMNNDEFLNEMKNSKYLKRKSERIPMNINLPPKMYSIKYDSNPDSPYIAMEFDMDNNGILRETRFNFDVYNITLAKNYRHANIDLIYLFFKHIGEPFKTFHTIINSKNKKLRSSIIVMRWDFSSSIRLDVSCTPTEDLQDNEFIIYFRIAPIENEFLSGVINENVKNKIDDTPFKTYIDEARKLVKESNKQ